MSIKRGQPVFVPRLQERFDSTLLMKTIEDSVKSLGYEQIRPEQYDVVVNFVEGNDVFVSLPTGGGKSLCFACLPLIYDRLRGVAAKSIAVIISPLSALMQDQVTNFSNRGVSAVHVGGDCSPALVNQVTNGEVQLTYMSPETILTVPTWREMFRNQHYQDNLICLAVDEAHLIEKWGKTFRTDFAHISEIRSLMPKWTNLMALTATANLATRKIVIRSLEMHGCYIKARNPNKRNIHYMVAEKPRDLMTVIKPIVKNVIEKGKEADRCIIFCRTYNDSSAFFELLVLELASSSVLTATTASGQTLRICEKFTACSAPNTKKKIIASFTHPNGIVRIVVATVAFGMGLDSPNVRTVIHWGPPEDLELYVQETGRGGRDNMPSNTILYYGKRDIAGNSHATDEVKRYCENMSECRRSLLMRQFTDEALDLPRYGHLCCDICASVCMCQDCDPDVKSPTDDSDTDISPVPSIIKEASNAPESIQTSLKEQLVVYRTNLAKKITHTTMLVGIELCTGLTDLTIANIAANCLNIHSEDDILKYGVTSRIYCSAIYDIINNNIVK